MSDRTDEKVADVLAHNHAEFMEHGPGLRYSTQIASAAKCPTGEHVLRVGLGAMGCGQMWGSAEGMRDDPEWAELPVEECMYRCGLRSTGQVTVCNWRIERGDPRLNGKWVAWHPTDKAVSCWIDGEHFVVSDDTRYYPGDGWSVPFKVIFELRSLENLE